MQHITKRFGGNVAVDDVTLELRAGEILALAGENGAGKTTLMRIAAGELAPDEGVVDDVAGVALVHQHFLLVNDFTIAENLALQRRYRFATRDALAAWAREAIAATGIDLADPSRRVETLSVGEKSKLELIKAIAKQPRVLILDEPTSVLTPSESQELFAVMRRLAHAGTAVVFISHKLPEVLEIAQRIVVMRRGRVVTDTTFASAEELAAAMVGRRAEATDVRATRSAGALVLDDPPLHQGEIVAIVGVAGNGQTQLAERLRDRFPHAAHIPEDRTRDGIIGELTVAENLALRAKANPNHLIELYGIKTKGPQQKAKYLSGGNQQKVILARELDRRPELVVAAEPARGLDIEATAFVHRQLRAAADTGAAILLITSDLDEAFALADAIHVIYRGKLSERLSVAEASGRVGALMAGIA
jgi:general nucleoside transport system ATP-binding protein